MAITDRAVVRLECLKLAHRHDRGPLDVVAHAKLYEDYVLAAAPEEEKRPEARVSGSKGTRLP